VKCKYELLVDEHLGLVDNVQRVFVADLERLAMVAVVGAKNINSKQIIFLKITCKTTVTGEEL
jgi:hypothetical protein